MQRLDLTCVSTCMPIDRRASRLHGYHPNHCSAQFAYAGCAPLFLIKSHTPTTHSVSSRRLFGRAESHTRGRPMVSRDQGVEEGVGVRGIFQPYIASPSDTVSYGAEISIQKYPVSAAGAGDQNLRVSTWPVAVSSG